MLPPHTIRDITPSLTGGPYGHSLPGNPREAGSAAYQRKKQLSS